MDVRHLRHFVAVAEEGHFGRAAARLGIEQSPLSRSIRQLEDQVRIPLLYRSAHGSHLTPAGAALLPEAKAILALVGRLKDRARALENGRARLFSIGVCDSLANLHLSVYLTMLQSKCPELTIDIQSVGSDQAVAAVEQGQVEAAIILGRCDTGTLCRTHFWGERIDVAVATGNMLAPEEMVPLSTVLAANELLVAQPWAANAESWLRDVAGEQACPTLRVQPTISALLTAVALDLGIALVPFGVAASFARVDITVRRIAGRQRRVPAVMLSPRDATHPAIAILREMAHERSSPRLSPLPSVPDGPAENPDHSP